MSSEQLLTAIFDADRALHQKEAEFVKGKPKALAEILTAAADEAFAIDDLDEQEMRLIRLSDLCAQVPTPKTVATLVRILDVDAPEVRVAAGEALQDVAYDHYAPFAQEIDKLLGAKHSGPVMAELPFILAEIGEASAPDHLKEFLSLDDADAVAAAIEAAMLLGEPGIEDGLSALASDTRRVMIEGVDEETSVSIGELATQALAALEGLFGDA